MYKIEAVYKDLFSLLKEGKCIVITDNDGTLFDSQDADAWRIYTILAELQKTDIPSLEEIKDIGYGKKVWLDGLIDALRTNYPKIEKKNLETLKTKLQDPNDKSIVLMGQNMKPIVGAKKFILSMKENKNFVAVCSDNYSAAVAEAINFHFEGVHCHLPDDKEPHEFASKKHPKPDDHVLRLNDTSGFDLEALFKPNPTKLLIQQFNALVQMGVLQKTQLNAFLENASLREAIKSNPAYRKTVYIGDDVSDFLAADNANFDYFVGVTNCGKCSLSQFSETVATRKSKIQVILVGDLNEFYNMMIRILFENKKGPTAFFDERQNIDSSVSHQATSQITTISLPKYQPQLQVSTQAATPMWVKDGSETSVSAVSSVTEAELSTQYTSS